MDAEVFVVCAHLLRVIEGEREDVGELVEDIGGVGAVGILKGRRDEFMELVVIDRFVVGPTGGEEHAIGDRPPELRGEPVGDAFLGAEDGLYGEVASVRFLARLLS